MTNTKFDYDLAFSRNLGWLTPTDQESLRDKKVAVAGCGGVGGIALITLVRLGVGKFNLADFDRFEIQNFNRQFGSSLSKIDIEKVEVMKDLALDINPELDMKFFKEGINQDNLDAFLEGVDLVVDALDFFVFDERQRLQEACKKKKIPILMSAPFGMGATIIAFNETSMGFDKYFGFSSCPKELLPIRFLVGLSPRLLHRKYLVYPEVVNFLKRRVPSLAIGCQFSAGLIGALGLKILLKRGGVSYAPYTYQFDAYEMNFAKCYRPFGYKNPLFKLSEFIVYKVLSLK